MKIQAISINDEYQETNENIYSSVIRYNYNISSHLVLNFAVFDFCFIKRVSDV